MNIFTITFIAIIIFNIIKNKKSLHMLQQNLYNENNRYLKWLKRNSKQVFISLDLLSLLLILVAYYLNNGISIIFVGLAIIAYIGEALRLLSLYKSEKTKKPLVITKRVRRLIVTLTVLFAIPLVFYLVDYRNGYLMLLLSALFTYFSYLIVFLAKVINTPVEKFVYKYYETKAKKKLRSMNHLKVIGITGSYGKTSSKNILSDILNLKYITRPTPKNLNTEYGLMITINNYLDKFDEVFIAEMGAYKRGEIKKLCDMVHPKYGILTRIGLAHLETFGSAENIMKTKFELIESSTRQNIINPSPNKN